MVEKVLFFRSNVEFELLMELQVLRSLNLKKHLFLAIGLYVYETDSVISKTQNQIVAGNSNLVL